MGWQTPATHGAGRAYCVAVWRARCGLLTLDLPLTVAAHSSIPHPSAGMRYSRAGATVATLLQYADGQAMLNCLQIKCWKSLGCNAKPLLGGVFKTYGPASKQLHIMSSLLTYSSTELLVQSSETAELHTEVHTVVQCVCRTYAIM